MTKQNTAKAAQPATDLRQRAARARDAAGRFIKRAAPVEAAAAPAVPDPALALIEKHRAAYARSDRLADVEGEMLKSGPGRRAAEAATAVALKLESAAYDALFSAQPTTLAGAAALGAYLGEAIRKTSTHIPPSDGERALATITAAIRQLTPPPASPHRDDRLITLGAEFVAAWTAEEEAPDGVGYWACNRLAQQIVQTPAMTVAGLGIKALLLARLDEDDSSPRNPARTQGPIASHWNVLRQVQEGAARLAASDMGIAISAAAEPETRILASAGPTGAALLDLLDLESASLDDLQSLHDIADLVGGVAYATTWTGRCKARGSGDEHNIAGKLMQWLGDALTDGESAANNEARRRAPLSCIDRETRLEMLALPVIQNGDPDETEAFARELLDHVAAERRSN